jgi:hypothetical protein
MRHLRKATYAWLSALLVAMAAPAIANDCPSGQTGRSGFVVERGERSTTEVFHLDGAIVRTVMRSGGNALLETTQFQGLLQLDRVDTGRRTTFRPKHQLAAIFPLKTGQQSTAEFEVEGAQGRASIATVVLKVLAKDSLFIGPCRYEILKIERSEGRGERPPQLINIDYYAPELKLVIAKEYKERDGRLTLIKFDRIYPIKR